MSPHTAFELCSGQWFLPLEVDLADHLPFIYRVLKGPGVSMSKGEVIPVFLEH